MKIFKAGLVFWGADMIEGEESVGGKNEERPQKQCQRRNRKASAFLKRNYRYGGFNDEKVDAMTVYGLFKDCEPNAGVNFKEFNRVVGTLGIRKKKRRAGVTLYHMTPLSDVARAHHSPGDKGEEGEKYSFNLVNVRGLLAGCNKVKVLDKFLNLGESRKIVAVTETHLVKGQHFDEEAIKCIPSYNMVRTDRNMDGELRGGGGTMVMTSPDITTMEVKEYCVSNSNCELTTVELDGLGISIVVIYRPSGVNFRLEKFREIMEKAGTYLRNLRMTKPTQKVIFCGD